MATESKMDVGILEKIGDAFTAFSEKTVSFLTRLMGSSNERLVRTLGLVRTGNAETPYRIISGSILARINASVCSVSGFAFDVFVSVGGAHRKESDSKDALIALADQRMYEAKRARAEQRASKGGESPATAQAQD